MKIHFKEKREKICTLSRNTNHLVCPFLPFTAATTPIWSPKGFWDGEEVGVESWASKLVVIAIVSVACLFVFESTMVNSGRSEV